MSTTIDSLGKRIRKTRLRDVVTLDALCLSAKVSKPYLSLIENDRVPPPSQEILKRIEVSLKTPDGFLTRLGDVLRAPAGVVSLIPDSTLVEFLNPTGGKP